MTIATAQERPDRSTPAHGVTFGEALRVWTRVALLSFGGPAAQIAVMHRILVQEKHWISESRFLYALNYCMLLPGPEAKQLAIYIGWLMHRTAGGIVAGSLFVVPGIISIMALSYVYALYGSVPFVVALFFGLKAAVLAIVFEAVVRIGKRALKNNALRVLAAAAFIGIFFFGLPFPLIVFGAALIGFLGSAIVLKRETQNDRGVTRVGVALIPGLVVVQKQLCDAVIRKPRSRRREAQAVDFEREAFGQTSMRQSFARAHAKAPSFRRSLAVNRGMSSGCST
jgi:chromate transport protein ChrA